MSPATIAALLTTFLGFPPGDADTLESVDRVRGGRHWIDAKTDPPRSPEESRGCFEIEPGLAIELFAAEPLVVDPVAIAFDERGRAFVVEYGDYPTGPPTDGPDAKEGAKPLSRVVLLADTDGDHRADRRTVFAQHLDFAHSLLPYDGGLIVGARTQLLFLKDTDGDDRADVRKVLFEGFTPAHPQMQIGNPRLGLDNRVYCNYGPGTITAPDRPGVKLEMPRTDFWFDPRTGEHGPAAGLGQFGNTIDDWGRRFFNTNRNPVKTAPIPWEASRRNPYATLAKLEYDVAPSGGAAKVFPITKTKSNYLSHAGTHTSACGVTAYRGDLLGEEYTGDLFVCEPIGHLVTRSELVEPDGVALVARRAREKADFLASTDTWFRPASLATGPDGALYLADMYRLWVEHPKFLPDDVAARIDWRAGDDRGRIWRITRDGAKPSPCPTPETTADLVEFLKDANGWRRSLGQRLIVERDDRNAIPTLRHLLRTSHRPVTRLHALWTLDGLDALTGGDIRTALLDAHPIVRRDAIGLAPVSLRAAVVEAAIDPDPRVRFAGVLAMGDFDHAIVVETLAAIVLRDADDPWLRDALLTSCRDRSGRLITELVENDRFTAEGTPGRIDVVRRLATVVGARGDVEELRAVLHRVAGNFSGVTAPGETGPTDSWWRIAIVTGLAEGLPRHRGDLGRNSLAKLLADPPNDLPVEATRDLLENATRVAVDPKRSTEDRLAAVQLLAFRSFADVSDTYAALLEPTQPVEVQRAALAAMRRNGGNAAAEIVLASWPTLGPAVRGTALDLLLQRTESTKATLRAMAAGDVSPSFVDLDRRVRLLRHREESVRELATEVFGGAVSANRREVARSYASAITAAGNATRGRAVFAKTCAKCHRINDVGHVVGPDISDVRNRSREALLYDVLDPNRLVEPRFTEYVVVTTDGRQFTGLLVTETATTIVLRRPEGKEETIDRSTVEIVKSGGRSLMPEGVEKEVTVEGMADLLEFLTSPKP